MKWFNNAPIRIKLIAIMSLTSMLALLLAISAVVFNEYVSKKIDTENQLILVSDIIAWNASAALTFKDITTAEEMLKGLENIGSILSAKLYDSNGNLFAAYQSDKSESDIFSQEYILNAVQNKEKTDYEYNLLQLIPKNIQTWFVTAESADYQIQNSKIYGSSVIHKDNQLHLLRPILLDGELQGILHLADDQSGLRSLLNRFYFIISIIIFMTGAGILFISSKLQGLFLAPLLDIIAAMRVVTYDQNFTRRLKQNGSDEFAEMAKAYNTMLSEIQQRDQKLAQHRDNLEQEVIARTQELVEKNHSLNIAIQEAIAARELAEAASKAKSQFLATMSHEIRTPMNSVLGMLELLKKTEMDNHQNELAQTAYRSGESLLGIINNILDFAKIEAGKIEISPCDFSLRFLLEETAEILAPQAHNKKIEILLNLPVDFDITVNGDPERLRQVLINLMANAIKFTQQGEVELKVNYSSRYDSNTIDVLFEVIDTGAGISLEQQHLIFDSFTQADGTITRQFGGTGLGLTISKELVELMGGKLQVESELNHGSRFYFSLPFHCQTGDSLFQANLAALNDLKVLVVDDNIHSLKIMQNQLQSWHINVDCATNPNEAEHLLNHRFNNNQLHQIILIDANMPYINGLVLASDIHSDPRYRHIAIIMLCSGNHIADNFVDLCTSNVYQFLTKPIIRHKLHNALLDTIGFKMTTPHRPLQDAPQPSLPQDDKGLILLVDDQEVNQKVGRYMLQDLGYQVETANNGQEALNKLQNVHYDLILMDCHMPEMDGFEATRLIRHQEQSLGLQPVPIIALTADVQAGIVEECQQAGMNAYLSKPFNLQQLENILKTQLQDKPII